jgi:antirestriction protein ArdC
MATGATSTRIDVYRKVTDTIISQIESGAGSYQMPWHHSGAPTARPRNAIAPTFYRGVNVLALWAAAHAAGFSTGLWATYRQWQLAGAQVREGERGTLVVFWKQLDHPAQAYTEDDAEEDRKPNRRMMARGFWVFNMAQVDGYTPFSVPEMPEADRNAQAEQFYTQLGIETRFGGDAAYYDPTADYVQMPPFERFKEASGFYSTLLHEGAHASGAASRLNRDLSGRFGSEAYAMEEMIADWTSAMACMTLEVTPEPRTDHAQYIASWLKVLRRDCGLDVGAANRKFGLKTLLPPTSLSSAVFFKSKNAAGFHPHIFRYAKAVLTGSPNS